MEYPLIGTWMSKEECHRSKGYIEVTVREGGLYRSKGERGENQWMVG